MEFEYSQKELEDKKDNMSKYVKSEFESRFRSIRTMIGYIWSRVTSFLYRGTLSFQSRSYEDCSTMKS